MEIEKELEQFRLEAQRLKAGRRSGSLPFPEELRAFAVRYAEHLVAAVASMAEAAQKLGVSELTLCRSSPCPVWTQRRTNRERGDGSGRQSCRCRSVMVPGFSMAASTARRRSWPGASPGRRAVSMRE